MNISKIMRVAAREFASTAMTKGFIIGALVVPAVMAAVIPLVMILAMSAQPPADTGTVYILDHSTEVLPVLEDRLDPEAVKGRWIERFGDAAEFAEKMMPGVGSGTAESTLEQAASNIKSPIFKLIPAGGDTDIDELKAELRNQVSANEKFADETEKLLAIVEIDIDATRKLNEEEGYGAYQAFFRPKLNDETVGEIKDGVRWSIRQKRYENADLDRTLISEINSIRARESKEITETGERKEASGIASFAIPFASMLLLLIASMTGGQYLLTTTVEEKSNRVVEVLLSAVSPIELMTGKIVGQMGVGLSLLTVYNSVGIMALIFFNRSDLVSPLTFVYFFIFFILAYFMFASLMAAIGSAVNDLREAQSLMTPVMIMMIMPYIFFMPVIRAPNSLFSTIMSMIPPISPFIMIMRVSSTDAPPTWQVLLAILINLVGVLFFLWFAAKVFRVGLLMFGKPPNLRTLIKWIRMA
ncbi:MAG: ABC transporter permease [Phycisphaerales bacterium]|nr:ABC transporter permease [Phycisphaerales bacterium]